MLKGNDQLLLDIWKPLMNFLPVVTVSLLTKRFSPSSWKMSLCNNDTGNSHLDEGEAKVTLPMAEGPEHCLDHMKDV